MGSFFDSIESELEGLERGGPTFAGDYNSNPAIIKQVQAAINALGYAPPLTVDGSLGEKTTAAIKWLQAQKGVTQDGIVGDQTLGSLGITPPGGTSVDSVTGAVTGAVASALAALQSEFAPLISWATSNHQPITQGSGVASGFQATRASVINSYVDWTTPLEGFVPHMYIDALGFVTTGMGNLIDPMSAAMSLPWKNADGSRATPAQIQAAWTAVDSKRSDPKGQRQTSGPAAQGGGTQGNLTTIRITKNDVKALVADRLKNNEKIIVANLPHFAAAPADAQLGVHSMAWAEGTGFTKTWPAFDAAFNRGDFATAAAQSNMQGTGIAMRNMANKLLFTNAAQVVAGKKDPDHLYYLDLSGLFSSGLIMSPGAILADIKAHPLRTGIIGSIIAIVVTTAVFMLKGQA
jgi:peptidoglycan hydrolase-like protein with peptidoglycan-binding domain